MWIDATSAAGRVSNPKSSQVADKVGFAVSPTAAVPNGSAWAWSWALAIPSSTNKEAAAKDFVRWATSKDYVKLVGETEGWVAAPPGTRKSTYESPEYQKAAPFAPIVLERDHGGRPDPRDQGSGPLYGRAVCRHSGVPGHRHYRGSEHFGRASLARTTVDGRRWRSHRRRPPTS